MDLTSNQIEVLRTASTRDLNRQVDNRGGGASKNIYRLCELGLLKYVRGLDKHFSDDVWTITEVGRATLKSGTVGQTVANS